MNRRRFVFHTLAGAAAASAGNFARAQATPPATNSPAAEPKRSAPQESTLVFSFVRAGHGDLAKVKEFLAQDPKLVHATWDWGGGDWETALGGASHVGNREIAEYLLSAGARIDSFCAAMLGATEVVSALLRLSPSVANARGPHGFSLLYHVGHGGEVKMAELVSPHLSERSRDCNQALQSAAQSGRTELVAWLLKNGVTDVNTQNFFKKTPLDIATERGHERIAKLLRDAGGTLSSAEASKSASGR